MLAALLAGFLAVLRRRFRRQPEQPTPTIPLPSNANGTARAVARNLANAQCDEHGWWALQECVRRSYGYGTAMRG